MAKGERGMLEVFSVEEQDNIILSCLNTMAIRGGKGSNKCSWTERAKLLRRQIIIDYIAQGLSVRRIIKELQARWGIEHQTAFNYIKDATSYLGETVDVFNAHNSEIAQERLQSIMEDALANNDRKTALQACDLLNKVQGLYVNKVEAETKTSTTIQFEFGGE
jgi:hypothetical protein